jgi:hypothetical protein
MIHHPFVLNAMNIGSLRALLLMTRNREIQARILNAIHKKQQYNKIHRAPKKAKRPRNNGNNNRGNTRRALF